MGRKDAWWRGESWSPRLMEELSATPKQKGRIAYADDLGGYAFTREYEENAFFQDCLDEYRDNIFWADLVTAHGGQGHQRTPGAGVL